MSFNMATVVLLLQRTIFLKIKVEPLTICIEQLMVGLEKFELLKRIREDSNAFRHVFCHSNVLIQTYDLFINAFRYWHNFSHKEKPAKININDIVAETGLGLLQHPRWSAL